MVASWVYITMRTELLAHLCIAINGKLAAWVSDTANMDTSRGLVFQKLKTKTDLKHGKQLHC